MKITAINNCHKNISSAQKKFHKDITNDNIKKAVINSAAASAIAAATMVKKAEISIHEIEQKLLKNGFTKDISGNITKTFSAEEDAALKKDYGYFAAKYKKTLQQPVNQDSLNEFKNFLDIDKTKSRNMFDKNFNKLFFTYSLLKSNNLSNKFVELCQDNKSYYTIFENLVNKAPDKNTEKILYKHKLDAILDVNESLRAKALDSKYKINDESQKLIDTISTFIDTQKIPEDIKLYRGEGFEIMKNTTLKDGSKCNVAEVMQKAAKSGNKQEIEKVKNFILDNEISTFQPGFMSVSIDKNIGDNFSRNCILWRFKTEPNTKGVYMEGLNIPCMHASENEVFVQKNSKIKITDVNFDNKTSTWILDAKISN